MRIFEQRKGFCLFRHIIPQAKAEVGNPAVSRPKALPAATHATAHPNLVLLRIGSSGNSTAHAGIDPCARPFR